MQTEPRPAPRPKRYRTVCDVLQDQEGRVRSATALRLVVKYDRFIIYGIMDRLLCTYTLSGMSCDRREN